MIAQAVPYVWSATTTKPEHAYFVSPRSREPYCITDENLNFTCAGKPGHAWIIKWKHEHGAQPIPLPIATAKAAEWYLQPTPVPRSPTTAGLLFADWLLIGGLALFAYALGACTVALMVSGHRCPTPVTMPPRDRAGRFLKR